MKTFVVLGMHRSATSLSAQGLFRAGVFMGERLLGSHSSNPAGHYEDIDFIHYNDMLLKMAGGSWDNPPSEKRIIAVGFKEKDKTRDFIHKKQREPYWGWKDPRTTLTIRCYLPFLRRPHFISCFRDPAEVAESLNARDGIPIDRGIALAKEYNSRMLKFLKGFASC